MSNSRGTQLSRRKVNVMRHLVSLALAATLLASLMVLPAAADDPVVGQSISATVALPNPTKAALPVTRHQRSTIFVGQQSNGVVSWYFEVDPSTWGGLFDLTSAATDTDLDIIFYADPGSLTDANEGATVFEGAAGVGESGIVPVGATYAVVYPAAGFNVPFDYTGYETPTVMLSGDLDISIANGQRIRFVNDTDSYGFVRGEKFTSGDGPADGIPAGDSFIVDAAALGVLFGAAEIPYTTHTGSGIITVTA